MDSSAPVEHTRDRIKRSFTLALKPREEPEITPEQALQFGKLSSPRKACTSPRKATSPRPTFYNQSPQPQKPAPSPRERHLNRSHSSAAAITSSKINSPVRSLKRTFSRTGHCSLIFNFFF